MILEYLIAIWAFVAITQYLPPELNLLKHVVAGLGLVLILLVMFGSIAHPVR